MKVSTADYSALTLRTPSGCELELLPAMGGLANRLRFCAAGEAYEVIAGLADRQSLLDDILYRGVPLFPVINRLDSGRYNHLGSSYQLPINEPERNNTLHGFLPSLTPTVEVHESAETSECTFNYQYRGHYAGYPFPADVQFHFVLHDHASLELTMSVTNMHDCPIPVGIGWHPYFTFGDEVGKLALQLPQVKKSLVNERMLPTGEQVDFQAFAQPQRIGKTQFDTCFAIQDLQEQSTVKTVLWSAEHERGIEVWQQTGQQGLNFLQLCIAPDRKSIAIEPVTCGINAFNTGEGLISLEPSERFSARMGVRLLTSFHNDA